MKKHNPLFMEHLFRPVYEANIAATWGVGALATPILSSIAANGGAVSYSLMLSGLMGSFSVYNGLKAMPLLKKQLNLATNKKTFVKASTLRSYNSLHKRFTAKNWESDPKEMFMGHGYAWGAEHAQRAYQVMDMDSALSEVQLPFFLKPLVKAMNEETLELGGAPWIHGMGESKRVMMKASALYGHTLVSGNVGMGKTVLLKMMAINTLHQGTPEKPTVLILIDPKNDHNMREGVKKEMKYLGMEDRFYHVHPANPSKSARLTLLKHYSRITEIASRVAPLMGSGDGGDNFEGFASGIITHASLGLDYLDEPVRLTTIQRVISSDRTGLANRVFTKYFEETLPHVLGGNWKSKIDDVLEQYGTPSPLHAKALYYNQVLSKDYPNKAVASMIEFALHDEGHYTKMIVGLRPIFTALTAEPLDSILSAVDDVNDSDPRPIVDIEKLMAQGGCLYISLDSLTDAKTAGLIGRLITSEIAAFGGKRYNKEEQVSAPRVTIIVDEAHAILRNNEALLSGLAQGRAAELQFILATQTVSDVEAMTDKATADRILGLCNNFISMRTTDPRTQEYVAQQFSKTSISQRQLSVSNSADTNSSLLDFSTAYGERLMKTREDMFPPELLGKLPVLQYIARLADGRCMKMKLDIVVNDDKPGEVAPWAA